MSRTLWTVYKQTGSGGSWELSTDVFYTPNEQLEKDKTSTLTAVKLANGSNAVVSPETKYNLEPLVLTFLAIDNTDTFIDNLDSYIENQTFLKLIDAHGNEMTGIFTGLKEVWLLGDADTKDYQTTFLRIDNV
jgi:nitrous oxide reductase